MDDRDRYELKIAGLLHDCGKVTTPVHVVDKATKLQTLFDRIDLIDTRFEVLKRDAEIMRCAGSWPCARAAMPAAEAAIWQDYRPRSVARRRPRIPAQGQRRRPRR
jgi:HD superfamily phosphodiesterase